MNMHRRPTLYPRYLPQASRSLRPYQSKVFSEYTTARQSGHSRILMYGPPGSGKTSVMAHMARDAYLKGQKTTILVPFNRVVTKSAGDLTQMCGALVAVGLGGLFGVFSGAFPTLQKPSAPIQIVTLQSLFPWHDLLKDSDVVLIDEGHTGSFFTEVETVYKYWQWKAIVNFTATPYNRSMGKDERFSGIQKNTIVIKMPCYRELESQGYLAHLRYHAVTRTIAKGKKLDLDSDAAIRWMLGTFVNRCSELSIPTNHAVVFAKAKRDGFVQMESIKRIGPEFGLDFTIVGDGISQAEDEAAIEKFEAGKTNLLNVQALTTGWDNDLVRHALFFRPVPSRDRCVQAATRVDRPHPNKAYGEIWDFAGNFQLQGEESGLHPKVEDLSEQVDDRVLNTIVPKNGDAPKKACVKCKQMIHASLMECPHCKTIQPSSQALYQDAKGQLVSFIHESDAKQNKAGMRAYFRQWRKIAFTQGWNPYSAHKKCMELGTKIAMDDRDYWLGSTGVSREAYQRYLDNNARSWGWTEDQKLNDFKREFGHG